ncbi:MAG: hypothetical protein QXV60_04125, partial [Nitrososphaerota archaeon]
MNGFDIIRLLIEQEQEQIPGKEKETKKKPAKKKVLLPFPEYRFKLRLPYGHELIPIRFDLFYRLGFYDFKEYVCNYLVQRGVKPDIALMAASLLMVEPVSESIRDFQWYFSLLYFVPIPASLAVALGEYVSFALTPKEWVLHHGRFLRTRTDVEVYEKYVMENGIIGKFRASRDKLVEELSVQAQYIDKFVNGEEEPQSVEEQEVEGPVKGKLGMQGIDVIRPSTVSKILSTSGYYAINLFHSCNILYKFLHKFQRKIWAINIKGVPVGFRDIDISENDYYVLVYYTKNLARRLQDTGDFNLINDVFKLGAFWENVLVGLGSISKVLEFINIVLKMGLYLAKNPKEISLKEFLSFEETVPISVENYKSVGGINQLVSILRQVKEVKLENKELLSALQKLASAVYVVAKKVPPKFEPASIGKIVNTLVRWFGAILLGEALQKRRSWEQALNSRYYYSVFNTVDTDELKKLNLDYFRSLQEDPDIDKQELFNVEGKSASELQQNAEAFSSGFEAINFNSYVDEFVWGSSGLEKQFIEFGKVYSMMRAEIDMMYKVVKEMEDEDPVYETLLELISVTKQYLNKYYTPERIDDLINERPISKDVRLMVLQVLFIVDFDLGYLLRLGNKVINEFLEKIEHKAREIIYWDEVAADFIKSQKDYFVIPKEVTPAQMTKINARLIHVSSVAVKYISKMLELFPSSIDRELPGERHFELEGALDQERLRELQSLDIIEEPMVYQPTSPLGALRLGMYVGFSHDSVEVIYNLVKYDNELAEVFYDIVDNIISKSLGASPTAERVLGVYKTLFGNVIADYVPTISKVGVGAEPIGPREEEAQIYRVGTKMLFDLFITFITFSYADIYGHYLPAEEYEPDKYDLPYINANKYANEFLEKIAPAFPGVKFFKHFVGHDVVIIAGAEDKTTAEHVWMASRTDVGRNFIGTLMNNKFSGSYII